MMPLNMGPIAPEREKRVGIPYREIQNIVIQYQTDSNVLHALLPDCYKPSEKPIVTVMFGYYDGLDFMAGGGYRIATIQVAAKFDGEQDRIEGDYIIVMYEDKTLPIITGREHLGVPKLYADISPVKMLPNGHLRCEASLWGHLLFGIDIAPLKKQNPLVRRVASKRISKRPWLCYKYIPSLDGPPDADYPTITWNDVKIEQLWLGKSGRIFFGKSHEEEPAFTEYGGKLIEALKTLRVKEVTQTLRMRGSAVLRHDISRRLQ